MSLNLTAFLSKSTSTSPTLKKPNDGLDLSALQTPQNNPTNLNLNAFQNTAPQPVQNQTTNLNLSAFGVEQQQAQSVVQKQQQPTGLQIATDTVKSIFDNIGKSITSTAQDLATGKTTPNQLVGNFAVDTLRNIITQPAARLVLSLQRAQGNDQSQTFTPGQEKGNNIVSNTQNVVEKALYGNQSISDWKTEAFNTLKSFGVSDATAKNLQNPVGLAFGAIDMSPLGDIKALGKPVFEEIAKATTVKDIVPFLSQVVKGTPQEIHSLAEGFVNIKDPAEVEKVITGLSQSQESLKTAATKAAGTATQPITSDAVKTFNTNIQDYRSFGGATEGTSTPNAALRDIHALADKPEVVAHTQQKVQDAIKSNELPVDQNGDITLYRGGKPSSVNDLSSATYDKTIAQEFAGKDGVLQEFKVKPEDIKAFIGKAEKEVLVDKSVISTPTPQLKIPEINTSEVKTVSAPNENPVISSEKPVTEKTPRLNPVQQQEALQKEGTPILEQRQAQADLAKEERSLYSPEQISDINKLKHSANAKAVQNGDIETLRARHPVLVERVLNHVKEVKGNMSDQEALDTALKLPTTSETVVKQPSELIAARALKDKVSAFNQGIRTGTSETRNNIKSVQSSLVQIIKDSGINLHNKGKLLATIKNVQTGDDLEKALPKFDSFVEDVNRREIKRDILQTQQRIIDSPSIAIDYKQQVKDLTKGFALQGKRESTLQRLQATQDFLTREEAKGNNVTIPRQVLQSLELLNRTPFEQITTNQLKGLKANLDLLETLGKTKLKTIQDLWRIQKDKILIDIANQKAKPLNEIPLIKPDIGEGLTLTQKFKNFVYSMQNKAGQIDRAISPMDTIFDLLDGGKGTYDGANFKYFKGQVDAGYGRYISRKAALQQSVIDLASKYKLSDRNFERMGVVAAKEQKGGIEKLLASDFSLEQIQKVVLNPQEQEVLDAMRKTFESQFPEIQDVMRRVYNQPVKQVKNYFSFMTDFKSMDDIELFQRFGQETNDFGAPKKNVEAGFTISRVGGKQKIKINAMDVFMQHTDNTSYLLELGETSKMLGEVAASDNYKNLVGDTGQLLTREWLDVVARKGGAAGAQNIALLDTLRRNAGTGVLGFKLSSIALQPTALIDGMGFIGVPWGLRGMTNFMINPEWRKFVMGMPEIVDRMGGEFALRELKSDNPWEKLQQKSFLPMEYLDQVTAGAVALGAYQRKMVELGKAIDFSNYDKEALAYAQLAVRRTQSSGSFKDVPLAISRGELTGNRSLDRAMLQFQNFLLTRWSRIRYDAIQAGINTKSPKTALVMLGTIMASALVGSGIRLGVTKIQDLVTGGQQQNSDQVELNQNFMNELLGNVPFLGTIASMALYGGEMFPILDAPKNTIAGLNSAINGKSEATKLRGLATFSQGAGSMVGIPGVTQVGQLVKTAIPSTNAKKSNSSGGIAIPNVDIPSVNIPSVDIPSVNIPNVSL